MLSLSFKQVIGDTEKHFYLLCGIAVFPSLCWHGGVQRKGAWAPMFPSQQWPPSGEAACDPSTVRETLPELLVGGLGRESLWFLVEMVRA